MLENRQKHVQNVILEKKSWKQKLQEINFYVLYMSWTLLYTTHCKVGMGVGSYPPRVTEHNVFIFGHFGSADPKNFFPIFSGIKS